MQDSSKKDFVEALARGLEVIRSFNRLHVKQTISQISERTLLARPTVLRLLLTLEELGYVRSQDNRYSLTPKVVDLGMAYVSALGLYGAAKPHMENLSKEVDQTISLAELDGSDIVYTGRVEVPKIVSVGVTVGARLPSASTALGRVLLAAIPDSELHDVLCTPSLSMFIPRARFTADQIRPRLKLVREQGWAESDEDLQYGVQAIAAPIRGEDGRVVAAIGLGTHTSEVGKEVVRERYLPLLLSTAQQIENDWEHCRKLPTSESALTLDGLHLLHLRRAHA
ncbi:MAG: IclR family transcriptional regulator [Actinomycetota bacterium]|jgi:IclR family pca regulon transcriptional regulator